MRQRTQDLSVVTTLFLRKRQWPPSCVKQRLYAMPTSGQDFSLKADIIAIEPFEDRMRAIVVPCGNKVRVVQFPCPHDGRMADVTLGR